MLSGNVESLYVREYESSKIMFCFCESSLLLFLCQKIQWPKRLILFLSDIIWDTLYRKDMLSLLLQLQKIAIYQVSDAGMISTNHITVIQELIVLFILQILNNTNSIYYSWFFLFSFIILESRCFILFYFIFVLFFDIF